MKNLENLNIGQKRHVVMVFFSINPGITYNGYNRGTYTVATMSDGTKHCGFFDRLTDYDDLFSQNKFRLVNASQASQYKQEITSLGGKARTGNANYTTIIDLDRLVDLRMIVAGIPEEVEVTISAFESYLSQTKVPA